VCCFSQGHDIALIDAGSSYVDSVDDGGAMQDYRKLDVWLRAHQLVLDVFRLAPNLKGPESWPLRDQMLRAAISIPSNIAEGAGRGSNPDFRRFLFHSLGSCNELEYDLLLGADLKVVPADKHKRLASQLAEVRRMLTGLVQAIS
jgi:four helix bundle protein